MSRCLESVLQAHGEVMRMSGGLSDMAHAVGSDMAHAVGSLRQPKSHREAMQLLGPVLTGGNDL